MNLNEQEDRLLRRYLNNTMQYRETQQEVYDHIVSALESRKQLPEDFGEAVTNIIREDFGGQAKLAKLEKTARWSATKSLMKRQIRLVGSYFAGIALLGSAICIGLVYWLLSKNGVNGMWFDYALFAIVFIPSTLCAVRYYKLGYRLKDTKPSIRDRVFRFIALVPPRLFIVGNLFFVGVGHSVWVALNVYIATALVTLTAIYIFAFMKLYSEDINLKFVA